ncbi:transposase [Streptomyces europaeiscabiei]
MPTDHPAHRRHAVVRACDVIRMLSRDGRPTQLGDAIAHCGRIAKPLHILRLADEPGYRRQIKVQADLQERRHALARKTFHGCAGQLCRRYQEGTEEQRGSRTGCAEVIKAGRCLHRRPASPDAPLRRLPRCAASGSAPHAAPG